MLDPEVLEKTMSVASRVIGADPIWRGTGAQSWPPRTHASTTPVPTTVIPTTSRRRASFPIQSLHPLTSSVAFNYRLLSLKARPASNQPRSLTRTDFRSTKNLCRCYNERIALPPDELHEDRRWSNLRSIAAALRLGTGKASPQPSRMPAPAYRHTKLCPDARASDETVSAILCASFALDSAMSMPPVLWMSSIFTIASSLVSPRWVIKTVTTT